MENQLIINQFVLELQAIGLQPVQAEDTLRIAYTYEKELQQKFNKIRDRYVPFWKSFGMKVDHNKQTGGARYDIPLDLISNEDLTDSQVDFMLDGVSRRLSGQ